MIFWINMKSTFTFCIWFVSQLFASKLPVNKGVVTAWDVKQYP
ncbi:hypothetical protein Xmau_00457 [Xenorhabdus mauleonii]|uniref:Uncharacterized protein n=1 Tax=Xenorhabdus mauleonii TaxID=351675 RepID=A0A1I3J0Y9_9GAMM|nr:hypothetical protein Xmau_00457 [Xenorhabdus mauleonii]SFI53932.1 hypothetical protein SAMN05421680_10253 [Xenorhabdus mauleonii]